MVDGSAAVHPPDGDVTSVHAPAADHSGLTVRVENADPDARARYDRFASNAVCGIPQLPVWVDCWTESTGADALIVTIGDRGRPAMALPLEVVHAGRLRVARFMGGRHANGNFPATAPDYPGTDPVHLRRKLSEAVRAARPEVDLLLLERQMRKVEGKPNLFSALPRIESTNLALAASLEGGFSEFLQRTCSKRRDRKHRYQSRRFEDAGGVRRIEARTPDEVRRLLAAFLEMKSVRFRQTGIPDIFAESSSRAFLEALFMESLGSEPPTFFLDGLEVGGKLRAVTGSSRYGSRMVCEFGAISDDELSHLTPGEFLTYENIREACEKGLLVYDYSVGDEPYKRMWCNEEVHHFDNLLPLTLRGKIYAEALKGVTHLKRWIKSKPTLRDMARRWRSRTTGSAGR